jgi:Gpi18-like mannosyltransferase
MMWRIGARIGLIAFFIRLIIILTVPNGFPFDMWGWVETTRYIVLNGFANAYSAHLQGNLYPPGFFYPLWITGEIYRACCSPQFDLDTPALDFLMRVGPIIADSFIAIVVYRLALLWSDTRRAMISGIAYAINPAALTTTAWMSMIGDPYYLLPALLSLLAALTNHFASASALIALAILIKPQALAFAPLIGFLIVTRATPKQIVRAGVAGVGATILVLLPFILGGTLAQASEIFLRMRLAFPFLHVWANNAWFLISGGRVPWGPTAPANFDPAMSDTNLFLGIITYRDIGFIAFGLMCLLTFYWLAGRAQSQSAIAGGALAALGFFIVSTRMHVNYSFPAFAFLSILCVARDGRYALALALATIAALFNWQLFDEWFPNPTALTTARLINSGIFVAVFTILLTAVRDTITRESRAMRLRVSWRAISALALGALIAASLVWFIWIRE